MWAWVSPLSRRSLPPHDTYSYIVDYPEGKTTGAEDFFDWEDIDFGHGPTIRVNHLFMFPEGAGGAGAVAANEQLYSSRYIRIALQILYCVPDGQDPDKPGFYLIEMNDSRMPDYDGLKLAAVRKVATSKSVQSTRDILGLYSKWLNTR